MAVIYARTLNFKRECVCVCVCVCVMWYSLTTKYEPCPWILQPETLGKRIIIG
jgi:hypothetical protein